MSGYNGWANWETWTWRLYLYDGLLESCIEDDFLEEEMNEVIEGSDPKMNHGDIIKSLVPEEQDHLMTEAKSRIDSEQEMLRGYWEKRLENAPLLEQIVNGFESDVDFHELAETLVLDLLDHYKSIIPKS